MQSRPKLKIKLTRADIIFEIVSAVLLMGMIVFVALYYKYLPENIPSHFDFSGNVDSYGGKSMILLFPILGTLLYLLLTIANFFPHTFNYLKEITEENALVQYTISTKMIRYLKFALTAILAVLTYMIYMNATNQMAGLGLWIIPVFLVFIFVPIAYFILKSAKK